MTLKLEQKGTKPKGLEIKSISGGIETKFFGGAGVHIGDYVVSIEDFCEMVRYVLLNTNLEGEDDPRLKMIEDLKKAKTTEGFPEIVYGKETPNLKRLAITGHRTISGE